MMVEGGNFEIGSRVHPEERPEKIEEDIPLGWQLSDTKRTSG